MLFIYILLGLAPSFIWLLYFLRKDQHPEPNKLILKVFAWGMLATLPALVFELLLGDNPIAVALSEKYPLAFTFFYFFIVIALTEEYLKYRVVKDKILKNPAFDEPLDAMLYMIISALGFAAMENIFSVMPNSNNLMDCGELCTVVTNSALRFLTATFLHALASGLLGFFLALSFFYVRKKFVIWIGIALATLLHGSYNFFIIMMQSEQGNTFIVLAIGLLGVMAVITLYLIKRIRDYPLTLV